MVSSGSEEDRSEVEVVGLDGRMVEEDDVVMWEICCCRWRVDVDWCDSYERELEDRGHVLAWELRKDTGSQEVELMSKSLGMLVRCVEVVDEWKIGRGEEEEEEGSSEAKGLSQRS